MNLLPDAGISPVIEQLVNGLPVRECTRQHRPLARFFDHNEHGIDDNAIIVLSRSNAFAWTAQESSGQLPLPIGQIRRTISDWDNEHGGDSFLKRNSISGVVPHFCSTCEFQDCFKKHSLMPCTKKHIHNFVCPIDLAT